MTKRDLTPVAERFWAKVAISEDADGCWLWTGALRSNGYGQMSAGRAGLAPLKAHRVAYELAYGAIPRGTQVLHRCDVRACVRPTHLWLGSRDDNHRDKVHKRRHVHGETHPGHILQDKDVVAIKAALAAGTATNAELARRYGVDASLIAHIKRRRLWAHLP